MKPTIPARAAAAGAALVLAAAFASSALAIERRDKIYYRGYQKMQVCHAGPVFTAAASAPYYSFNHIEGFSYLDFCTWSLGVNDKCADFDPASEDCAGMTSCPP